MPHNTIGKSDEFFFRWSAIDRRNLKRATDVDRYLGSAEYPGNSLNLFCAADADGEERDAATQGDQCRTGQAGLETFAATSAALGEHDQPLTLF
jgi:hypothetical protein